MTSKPSSKPPHIGSLREFLLDAPLYAVFSLDDEMVDYSNLAGVRSPAVPVISKFDGFCPYCSLDTTFTLHTFEAPKAILWSEIKDRLFYEQVSLTCARELWHTVLFHLRISRLTIQKIGQFPSLADIANSEVRAKYRPVLKGENAKELHKAIGLAAHGEGIASFVYLRRILERLVRSRFDEFKEAEGWSDEQFSKSRMEDKIKLLSGHLPEYLVSIRRIYSIFSLGIHELDNTQCLNFFEIGKRSIIMILEDDLKKQQELAVRKELQEAIAKFAPNVELDETREC